MTHGMILGTDHTIMVHLGDGAGLGTGDLDTTLVGTILITTGDTIMGDTITTIGDIVHHTAMEEDTIQVEVPEHMGAIHPQPDALVL